MAILPTKNSDDYGNAKDPYVNDVDNGDDSCENNFVTGFRREKSAYILKERHIRRPI